MADGRQSVDSARHKRAFDMRALWRLAIWGSSAAVALVIAVVAGSLGAPARGA